MNGEEVTLTEISDDSTYLESMAPNTWYEVKLNAEGNVIGRTPIAWAGTAGVADAEKYINEDIDIALVFLEILANCTTAFLGSLVMKYEFAGYILIKLRQTCVNGACLLGAVGHHHGTDAAVAQSYLAAQVIACDVIAKRIHVILVCEHLLKLHKLLHFLKVAYGFLHFQTEFGFHVFAQELERVAVGYGLVVEILMDIGPEHLLGVVPAFHVHKGRSRKRKLHRFSV